MLMIFNLKKNSFFFIRWRLKTEKHRNAYLSGFSKNAQKLIFFIATFAEYP
jgi:hypothetical protein